MKRAFVFGLLIAVMAAGVFASESDGIFSYRVGQYEVFMLVERQNPGNAGILAGAREELLAQYIPANGFTHSTNAFLVRGPGQVILIDTGFGQTIFDKMKSLGVEPEQVTAVLLTHLHGDHIGGLQRDGKTVFPNAKVYLSVRERDHFTVLQVNRGAVAALEPYGSQIVTFDPQEIGSPLRELIPGIYPIASYGHTPGHTSYLLQSGGSGFIIAGDFLHVALVQFAHPDISSSYDMYPREAASSRTRLLEYAARNRFPIGGMHIVYPGVGLVETEGSGFRFIPR